MKIINALKPSTLKALFTRAAIVGVLAGAALLATPQKASAQIAIGIHFGHPIYRGPVYIAPAPIYTAPIYTGPVYETPAYGFYGYERRYAWDHRFEHRGFYR